VDQAVARASDVLAVGDMVDAVVLNVNKDEQKISLGIRQTESNPWERVAEKYSIGARVTGKVRNFTNYGAFVELEEGIDGMIHVSDMSWTRKVNHPSEVLKKGDEVEAVVLEVDSAQQRISLGLKQAQDDPWTSISSRFKIGQMVKGKVTKLASFGAFVEIEEGVDGLVHISQISDDRVQKVRDVLQPGQEVEARVIKIDPVERRIGLSIKAAKLRTRNSRSAMTCSKAFVRARTWSIWPAPLTPSWVSGSEQKEEEWHPGEKKDQE
jgi:small subunit ribosomal protein S1